MKFLLSLFLLGLTFSLLAQKGEHLDYVFLKGNNYLKGKILPKSKKDSLQLLMLSGNEMMVGRNEILRTKQSQGKFHIVPGKYFYKTRGMFFDWGFIYDHPSEKENKNSGPFDWPTNLGIHFSTGYRLSNHFRAGISVESNIRYLSRLPVSLELKGAFTNTRIAPVYSFSASYSFFLDRDEFSSNEKPVEVKFFPALGFRWTSLKKYNTEITLGPKWTFWDLVPNTSDNWITHIFDPLEENAENWRINFVARIGFVF